MDAAMKKAAISLAILLSASIAYAGDWDFEASYRQGLLYADRWDPGFSGAGLSTMAWKSAPFGSIGAGLELGAIGGAWHVAIPVAYRYEYLRWDGFSLGLDIELDNGVALYRPAPLWLWGAAIRQSISMDMGNRWALGLSLGLGYSACPGYEAIAAGPFSSTDLIVKLYARKSLRRAE